MIGSRILDWLTKLIGAIRINDFYGIRVEAIDRKTKQWLPAEIVEASCLNNVFWVRIHYPEGRVLERPRNIAEIRFGSRRGRK